ncbi:hypothetical protein [Lysinibacillus sp. FSL K6-3209]|uniref:hypothetical protein n=1 Tax=Lysinibacillus sp. FSL K6-3209 TaxID=2921497 RepID=UPI0030D72ACE
MKKYFFVNFITILVVMSICTGVNAESITNTQDQQKIVSPLEITQKTDNGLSVSDLDVILLR